MIVSSVVDSLDKNFSITYLAYGIKKCNIGKGKIVLGKDFKRKNAYYDRKALFSISLKTKLRPVEIR